MFAFGGHVFCPFATEIVTHTQHAQSAGIRSIVVDYVKSVVTDII